MRESKSIMKLEPPKAPSKTLRKLAEEIGKFAAKEFDCKKDFPCIQCGGKGYRRVSMGYYDTEDVNCLICLEGTITKKAFKSYWNQLWLAYRSQLYTYEIHKAKLRKLYEQLTTEEIQLLRTYEL
jgi:hypothetical protein